MAESIVLRYLTGHSEFSNRAFAEIVEGKKSIGWHWLLFPVPVGMSNEPLSKFYQFHNSKEVNAYYENPELQENFHRAIKLMLNKSVFAIHLLFEDDLEHVHASLTMFNILHPEDRLIVDCLEYLFHGKAHERCRKLIFNKKFIIE